jgi:hypothetical protein
MPCRKKEAENERKQTKDFYWCEKAKVALETAKGTHFSPYLLVHLQLENMFPTPYRLKQKGSPPAHNC